MQETFLQSYLKEDCVQVLDKSRFKRSVDEVWLTCTKCWFIFFRKMKSLCGIIFESVLILLHFTTTKLYTLLRFAGRFGEDVPAVLLGLACLFSFWSFMPFQMVWMMMVRSDFLSANLYELLKRLLKISMMFLRLTLMLTEQQPTYSKHFFALLFEHSVMCNVVLFSFVIA